MIEKPTNGNFHPIVRIVDDTHQKGASCTAFVVSDTIALTAAHCIVIDASFLKINKDKMMKMSHDKVDSLNQRIAYIKANCIGPQFMCDDDIAKLQFQIEIEIKARELFIPSEFKVFDTEGLDTGVKATAKYKKGLEKGYDFGILTGDFKKFDKIKVSRDFNQNIDDEFRVCGYPNMTHPISCTKFKYVGNSAFLMKGVNCIWAGGISGSPLINENGLAVGIASSVNDGFCLAQPTLGVLSAKRKK